ncbi:MAG: amidase [Pusillimonas sp.]|nr:MAG: amidase [Pusillimonas sp.]
MIQIKELSGMTVSALTAGYRDGSIDPMNVMELTLRQIADVNRAINALYGVDADTAMSAARASKARYVTSTAIGPLDGVPVTIKDSVHAVGMRWHHGSAAHGDGVVATRDAPPTERLKASGAIIIAKCTMPDYGLSGSGVSSYHGIVRNPWGLSWNTGGSSAGAGASLAAGIGMMSVGSDIAGSVRLPASHCGLAALKPTQGMIAHTPASDVRSAGPMTRYASDLELLLNVLGGVHDDDRFSLPVTTPTSQAPFNTLTVGAYADFGFGPKVEPSVLDIFGKACNAMASICEKIVKPAARYNFDAYLPIDASLKLRGWREYIAASAENRDKTPQQLIDWFSEARHWTADNVTAFERGLAAGVTQTNALFEGVDFLITPVMPIVNFPAEALGIDPAMPLRHCTFTATFNQSGHPAVSICGGLDARGLPVGIQIVGRRFDDVRLVRLATALEAAIWPDGRPAAFWPLQPHTSQFVSMIN